MSDRLRIAARSTCAFGSIVNLFAALYFASEGGYVAALIELYVAIPPMVFAMTVLRSKSK